MEEIENNEFLENLVWECTEDSIEEAIKSIPRYNRRWTQKFLLYVSSSRFLYYKLLSKVFIASLNNKKPAMHFWNNSNMFPHYLYAKNIISKEAFKDLYGPPKEENLLPFHVYEDPIESDKFLSIVKKDREAEFGVYTMENNIDLSTKTVNLLIMQNISILDYASYIGSFNVLRYLILNGVTTTEKTPEISIMGGHEKIIYFLYARGLNYQFQLATAIKHHNNDVVKWLLSTYNYKQTELSTMYPLCIESYNTNMFIYLLEDLDIDITCYDYALQKSLLWAAKQENYPFVKFLLYNGADKKWKDKDGVDAILCAETREMKKFLKTAK